ncbi:UNVERIFIED_CONTAM: hypothetical protein Slati_3969300 [Sesamum latifolium]|uniref:Reverse transcriptase domain-containing protein n=1 Tax=Sesamum latifolium TaxID=2727402 RepID=A0AAW2TPK2_9LAMI
MTTTSTRAKEYSRRDAFQIHHRNRHPISKLRCLTPKSRSIDLEYRGANWAIDESLKGQVEEAQAQKEEESQEKTKGSPLKLNLDDVPPYIPYPKRILKENLDNQFGNFLEIFKKIHINIPLIDALSQMSNSAKFLKEVLSNKNKWEEGETMTLNEECSIILQNKLPPKLNDPDMKEEHEGFQIL